MSFSLGLDTGGTYTDAVVFDNTQNIVTAKAKSLTTRHNLAIGIAGAAAQVLERSGVTARDISLVSISTTLATNALVEGQGGRVALIMIGFSEKDIERAGLKNALRDDPIIFLPGGHDTFGNSKTLDLSALDAALDDLAEQVSAFAVAGYFAVRNPEHENAVRAMILDRTQRPVTCSHELSSKLDGPKRALTTLLNARLIDMIARLINATQSFLDEHAIEAPLMVVRGDGSLISSEFALHRPIETILSGPAASMVGAHFLTGVDDAIIADIGGTTTDIAILDQGRPRIDETGASVGGYHTMVDAVAMRTHGLGGDSEVKLNDKNLHATIQLGPRRLAPISLVAASYPDIIISALKRQLNQQIPTRLDGRFAFLTGMPENMAAGLSKTQAALLARITTTPQPLDQLLRGTAEVVTLDGLASRGLVLIAGFTPSDANHVCGAFNHWNREAAALAAELFAKKRDGNGKPICDTPEALCELVINRLTRLSAEHILESVFYEDGLDGALAIKSPLIERALDRTAGIARMALFLDRPLIGLGAGAAAYYPVAADTLGLQCIVPDDADVANAIGAVVGQVRVQVSAEIVQNENMQFAVTGSELELTVNLYAKEEEALAVAKSACERAAHDKAQRAGAHNVVVVVNDGVSATDLDGKRQFISATIVATASGRPAA
ncbi:hydantoinase/oxoprolinase family protein [Ahrensia kielensis]|uniref:Hydantoinase/oxoprolinase family protein n=1 Tax=Ahrensia kielensis TaxID=76980 RepID=A0ABU9T6X2_9HYPH